MADRFNLRDRQRRQGDTDSEFGGRISVHRARQMNDGDYRAPSHSDREKQFHAREPSLSRSSDGWHHAR
ncbi:MAG: hypothetical protein V4454_00615 [Pseudomonadota bacterium]